MEENVHARRSYEIGEAKRKVRIRLKIRPVEIVGREFTRNSFMKVDPYRTGCDECSTHFRAVLLPTARFRYCD